MRAGRGPLFALLLAVPLAGCVDTSFDVCASNATDRAATVEVWVNTTGSGHSGHYTGTVLAGKTLRLGHFKDTEGRYTVDAHATPAGNATQTYSHHGPPRELGAGSRTLYVHVQPDGVVVQQGESGIVPGRTC